MQIHPDLVGWAIGIAGLLLGAYGIWDARRQRDKVERLLQLERGTIHELNGFLNGLKPALPAAIAKQVSDQQEFVSRRNATFERIASGR